MSEPTRIHRPLYRVFHLNRVGGIERADIIEALDDEDAIGRVHTMADDHAVELWDRARFIAKVVPPAAAFRRDPVVVRGESEAIGTLAGVEGPADGRIAKLVH